MDSTFCRDIMELLGDPFIDLDRFNKMVLLKDDKTGDTVLHCILKLEENRATKKMLNFYLKRLNEMIPDERTKFDILNMRNNEKDTPLHVAIKFFETKKNFVRMVLNQHVDLTIEDRFLREPLHKAAFFGDVIIAKQLIEFGADVNRANKKGDTPLHFALMTGSDYNVKMVRMLLNNDNIEINAKNDEGDTPLHLLAMTKNNVASLAAMHRRGADPNIVNKKGDTPIDIMQRTNRKEYLDYFIKLKERKERLRQKRK